METCDLFLDECKFANDTTGEFRGVAVTFGTEIPHPVYGSDVIRPGAFARSLATKTLSAVKMLWMHNTEEPIGQWLSLKEDAEGLQVQGRLLTELPKSREVLLLMQKKIVDGLSIGFNIPSGGARTDERTRTRTISEVELMEISPVVFPADVKARIREVMSARATWSQVLEEIRRVRRMLRSGR